MSVIGRKPFVNYIIDECSTETIQNIISLMDGEINNEPLSVTLDYLFDDIAIAISNGSRSDTNCFRIILDPLQQLSVEGILVWRVINDDLDIAMGLFGFDTNSGNMSEYEIHLDKTFKQVYEHLTVEELRQVCGDALSNGGESEPVDSSEVPVHQATATIVIDALTNLNGRKLTAYEATNSTYYGYPIIKITRGGKLLTEEQAENYMEYMTGSRFLPYYDYNRPKNSIWIMADGTFWKPQWLREDHQDVGHAGLVLYKITNPFCVIHNVNASNTVLTEEMLKTYKEGDVVYIVGNKFDVSFGEDAIIGSKVYYEENKLYSATLTWALGEAPVIQTEVILDNSGK